MVLSATSGMARNEAESATADTSPVSDQTDEEMKMYAMLDSQQMPEPGLLAQHLQKLVPIPNRKVGIRPMLLWFHWANLPKPFGPCFLFILFISVSVTSVMPVWVKKAEMFCKQSFWRTFFVGCLIATLTITLIRGALLSMFGWPMSVLVAGAFQLSLLVGLSVMVLLIGESLGYYLKLDAWIKRPDVRRLACLVLGTLICVALLQIPGIGILPKIGTRLVAMLALVGLGGLYRSRQRESAAP